MIVRDVKLHQRAGKTLQQGVMQILGDASPFRQPLLKKPILATGHLAEAPLSCCPGEAPRHGGTPTVGFRAGLIKVETCDLRRRNHAPFLQRWFQRYASYLNCL